MHSPDVDPRSDVLDTPPCRLSRRRSWAAEREYPPPIPSLPSHMPWMMKRYYSGDGRLVLKEEKVKRQDYFQAHRSNGRLVMYRIPLELEDAVDERHGADVSGAVSGEEMNGGDEGIGDPTVDDGEVKECYKYNGMVGVNPCAAAAVAANTWTFRPPVQT